MLTVSSVFLTHPDLFVAVVGLFGLLVGSFLNVVVHRLPLMLERAWQAQELAANPQHEEGSDAAQTGEAFNLAVPRSHCPQCLHTLSAWENIPVLSYLLLRGRCHGCSTHISARYPLVEIASGLLAMLVAAKFGYSLTTLVTILFSWALLCVSLIDFDHQIIPDDISLPLLWLGLVATALGYGVPGVMLYDAVIGASAGYLTLWGLYWAFLLATGKHGLGYGDFKLLAALCAWLGWQALLAIVLLASLAGAVCGMLLITLGNRDKSQPMPFGPFLAGAGFLMLIWGPQLIAGYAALFIG